MTIRAFAPLRRLTALILSLALLLPAIAEAQGRRMSFIRDAEIEATLRSYATPLLQAAGLSPSAVRIVIVDDPTMNAFVAGGQNLFVNVGLLRAAETPDELLGVIAHEIGHIAGGHILRGEQAMRNASLQSILATVLGIGAAVAAKDSRAGSSIMLGGQEMARRNLLAFSRDQEGAADAAALTYLDRAGLPARGLERFLAKLEDQELLPADRQIQFVLTHPLTRDRIDMVRAHVARSPRSDAPLPDGWAEAHARMIAKLDGFVEPARALWTYDENDPSFAARYARAIAMYRQNELEPALKAVDSLLAEEPANPWLHELKGQILMENGRIAESIAPYRRAVELRPGSGLLRMALGHALLEHKNQSMLDEAVLHLREAVRLDPDASLAWRFLARAYGEKGDLGAAALALAEEGVVQGDDKFAAEQARRAADQLPSGSPGWLRAQDILASTASR